jgi:hypothetical protein
LEESGRICLTEQPKKANFIDEDLKRKFLKIEESKSEEDFSPFEEEDEDFQFI